MAAAVLEASNLCVRRMGRNVFQGVGISLAPCSLLQVTGANGAGKTSLLRVLASLLVPAHGELRWRGRAVHGGDADYLSALAYIGHANGIDTDLSAAENLRFAARIGNLSCGDDAIARALARVGLDDVAHVPVRTLSQGQRRRVSLARLALVPRALWLLDEPLTSLDHASADHFRDLLDDHLSAGGIAVIATHQRLPQPGDVLDLSTTGSATGSATGSVA